ncbi:MAG: hypothetical protein KAT15_11565, partial [Bacteroidales bacterium]|nr:hypothetical protein [Bacteroidales bacterium]
KIENVLLGEYVLGSGKQYFTVRCKGKNPASSGMCAGLVSIRIEQAQSFVGEWSVIGPFDNPDSNLGRGGLVKPYPPEMEINFNKSYKGKNNTEAQWQVKKAEKDGFINFDPVFVPDNDKAVAYALCYVWSPDKRDIKIYMGSDDGCRIWMNDELILHRLLNRSAIPDDDIVDCTLKKGWNKLMVKVENNTGGWGFYLRIPNADNQLKFNATK